VSRAEGRGRLHAARGPHGSMFRRVYLHGLLLLFLVALAVAAVGWALGRNFPPARTPDRLARWTAERVGELVDRPDRLRHELERASDAFGVAITAYGPAGEVIASSADPPVAPLDAGDRARVAGGALHVGGRGPFTYAAPIPDGRGYVLISGPARSPHLGRAALFVAAVLLALALGSIPLAHSIANPIERLTAAAQAFGAGDLSVRTGLRAGGEVGELARAFDEMAGRVERLVRGERELLANVSHELRTPMARIRVALELAAEGDLDRARRFLGEIGADLDALDRLVEEILAAARLDLSAGPGGLPVHRERLDLGAVLADAADRFRAEHPGRALELDVAAPAPQVDGDPALLARLLRNLLDNARKYSDPDAPVTLAARARHGAAELEVRDRGIGVDAADLPRLFTPFFRTDRSRARDTGGVGLGLALAKRIAEAHGGAIAAESAPGRGTTIRVTLPAAP
jgi:two-component system OmpR family sensor kinase